VTHIVGYDPEEHDADEVIEEEERLEKSGEEIEKTFLRTIGVKEMNVVDDEDGGGDIDNKMNDEGGTSGVKTVKKKMALVHWWYFPSSYDEWLPAKDVAGETETEPPKFPKGVAVVGCKFVRDVEKFNEWGVESDYAIMEYERKLAIFRSDSAKSSSSSKKSNSKRKKSTVQKSSSEIDPSSKKLKRASAIDDSTSIDANNIDEENPNSNPFDTNTNINFKALPQDAPPSKRPSKTTSTIDVSTQLQPQHRTTSDRRRPGVGGMNPRRIHTGFLGSRGESLRRTVYDGALSVNDDAHTIIRDALADFLLGSGSDPNASVGKLPPLLAARPEMRKLLPSIGFVRPSLDSSLPEGMMTVTEITVPGPSAKTNPAVNRKVPVLIWEVEGGKLLQSEEPMRIRGGGDETQPEFNAEGQVITSESLGVRDASADDTIANVASAVDAKEYGMEVERLPPANAEDFLPPAPNDENQHVLSERIQLAAETERSEQSTIEGIETSQIDANNVPIIQSSEGDATGEVIDLSDSAPMENTASSDDCDVAISSQMVPESNNNLEQAIEHLPSQSGSDPSREDEKNAHNISSAHIPEDPRLQASLDNITADANTDATTSGQPQQETTSTEAADDEEEKQKPVKHEPETEAATVCEVVPLPANHRLSSSMYHTTHTSSTQAEDEASSSVANLPSWYEKSKASGFEQRHLPEWFNGSAPHRTAESYVLTREKILEIARCNRHQYITATALRRSINGDAGSLLRLHRFLTDWGFLNNGVIGESTPSDAALRGFREYWKKNNETEGKKRPFSDLEKSMFWSPARIQALEGSVLRHFKNEKVMSDDGQQTKSRCTINWIAVASDIGGNVTPTECQRAFIEPPGQDDDAPTAVSASGGGSMKNIIRDVRPKVLRAVIDASLKATDDIDEARKAAFVGAVASAASDRARAEEREIERTLMDIVDQRVQRLENRVALLDDVEALLEAERVSLELERRDLYTARCRHWFGDGST